MKKSPILLTIAILLTALHAILYISNNHKTTEANSMDLLLTATALLALVSVLYIVFYGLSEFTINSGNDYTDLPDIHDNVGVSSTVWVDGTLHKYGKPTSQEETHQYMKELPGGVLRINTVRNLFNPFNKQ